jgi:ketosteroid isomerase-like protein
MSKRQHDPEPPPVPAGILERLDRLEADGAVRRLMAALHDAGDANEGEAVAELFTPDGVWEGTGRLAVLGTHRGRAAIARRYSADVHPMSFTAHFLTSEAIVVHGDSAHGSWRYLQAGTVHGQALWIGGRYRARFRRDDGTWRIAHLQLEPLFTAPNDEGWPFGGVADQ